MTTEETAATAKPLPASSAASFSDGSVTTPAERKRAFQILFLCQLAGGMGQTLVYAVMPPIARRLGMSEFETTMIYSLSSFLWIVTSPFWGRRSDVVGRKPIMMIGLLAFAISTTIFATLVLVGLQGWIHVSLLFPMLLVARSIFGGLGSGNGSAAQAYVADRTTRSERASGVASLGAAFGIGTAIGPGVAAAFAVIHVVAPFYAVAILGFVSAGLIWVYLPERMRPTNRVSERQGRKTGLRWYDRRALPWVAISITLSFAQSIVMQLCAFYFIDMLHLKLDDATQMVSVGLMAMAIAALFAQIGLIQRFNLSIQWLLRWGAIITIFSFIGLIAGFSYGILVTALTLSGLGFGLLRPGLQAGASLSVSHRDQGAMAGFIAGTSATGMILTPFIFLNSFIEYNVYERMHQAPFIVGALLVAGILAFALFHPSMRDMQQSADDHEDEEEGIGIQ
ncbi:MFS transporter [Parvibaculum sedimenti]|uniref:MFS transporter n=2 Tax=Parvibaculum sedimenti TaxID=2608632 RepID=A0A6N6VMF1_9HYPH|nr:MFS transporter [Parvibaculum sedimenti]KAB7740738.1 MFS transporter [Parvibaculum sedimenti]